MNLKMVDALGLQPVAFANEEGREANLLAHPTVINNIINQQKRGASFQIHASPKRPMPALIDPIVQPIEIKHVLNNSHLREKLSKNT